MMLVNSSLQRFEGRQGRRVLLMLILPATQGALDLFYGIFRFHSSHNRDHHSARTIVFTMKFDKITALDLPDRFRKSIFRAAVGMALKEDVVEDHRSHIRGVFCADGETCQQLCPKLLHFRLGKNRCCKRLTEELEQERKIFGERAPMESRFMNTRIETQPCPDGLESIVDFVEGAAPGAAHQGERCIFGKPQFLVRVEQGASLEKTGDNHRGTVEVRT